MTPRWLLAAVPLLLATLGLVMIVLGRGESIRDYHWYYWIIMAITFNTLDRRHR